MNALARSFQCVCRRRYLTWLLDLSCLRNRRVTDVAGGKCWRTDLVNSSNPRPQGQGVTICLGLQTRVRFRVPAPLSKGQTLLWPFSCLPETPVLARVSRFVRKGRPLPAPSFSRVFALCALRSLFLRKPAFARGL